MVRKKPLRFKQPNTSDLKYLDDNPNWLLDAAVQKEFFPCHPEVEFY